jgi:hypothetical protein
MRSVVTEYRELLTLAHDPHVNSNISRSPIAAQPAAHAQPDVGAEHMQAHGREPSLIVSDPARTARLCTISDAVSAPAQSSKP